MKRAKLLLPLLLLSLLVRVTRGDVWQEWVARYDGTGNGEDEAQAVVLDPDGNVCVTGRSEGEGTSYDCVTVKYRASGAQDWAARYDDGGQDEGHALAADWEGNIYVAGQTYRAPSSYDYLTIGYDRDGTERWVRRYDGPAHAEDCARAIAVDDSGNVYVTGQSAGSGTSYDYATVKYSPDGDERWVRTYDGPGHGTDDGRAIARDDSGNVFVAGWSHGAGTSYDYATVKYRPDGSEAWVRRYDGLASGSDYAHAITTDRAGNVYLTGACWVVGGGYDYLTVKYDSRGNQDWASAYNGPYNGFDSARAVAVDDSGNVYVTGDSGGLGTGYDYATVKYGPGGDEAWVARYNGTANYHDHGRSVACCPGGVLVTGRSVGSASSRDYLTMRYRADGSEEWAARYDGPAGGLDHAWALVADADGNAFVTGDSEGLGTGADYATIRYSPTTSVVSVAPVDGHCRAAVLHPACPNPSRGEVTLALDVPGGVPRARLAVYNVRGELVKVLFDGPPAAVRSPSRWGGTDERGARVSAGVYFARLEAGPSTLTRKIVLLP